jgi:hypothetical protein
MVDISADLVGEVIFGTPIYMWDKNNNTPFFSLYKKLWIKINKSSNQNLWQL